MIDGKIYKITNIVNSKIYVGKTISTLSHRFKDHAGNKGSNSLICRAIRKYGKQNFTIEQIDFSDNEEELNKKEIKWISDLNSKCYGGGTGYNMTDGGEGQLGRIQTVEEKDKRAKHYYKAIICMETGEIFKSIVAASKALNIGKTSIGNNLRGISSKASGLSFEYVNKKENVDKKENIKKKKIVCIELNEIFDSATDAAVKIGVRPSNISAVAMGKRKSTKGFTFKYACNLSIEQGA